MRLTYPHVASTLALVVALGTGTATAAKMITGKQIRNGSVTGKDIRDGSIGQRELRVRAVAGAVGPAGRQGPAGPAGPMGARGPAGPGVEGITFRPYEYGVAGVTERGLFESFVGADGQPGAMGVRSRQPDGNPDAGAMLYARDYRDDFNLALDYRQASRPRLISESGAAFRVQTGAGAPIVLDPSGWVDEAEGEVRAAPPGAVVVNGYVTLPSLGVPPAAPAGSLAVIDGRLHFRAAAGWVAVSP